MYYGQHEGALVIYLFSPLRWCCFRFPSGVWATWPCPTGCVDGGGPVPGGIRIPVCLLEGTRSPGHVYLCGCVSEYLWLGQEWLICQVQPKAAAGGKTFLGTYPQRLHRMDWTGVKVQEGACVVIASLATLKWVGSPGCREWHTWLIDWTLQPRKNVQQL